MGIQIEEIKNTYEMWLARAVEDADVARELREMQEDPARIEDAFYRELKFGTGGLRGVIGAGTNRMNTYTVGKASQGLADYVCDKFPEGSRSIAISYDSRIKSRLFAETAARIFAANGIDVHMYRELMPTPMLSWAVRTLHCSAGVMVTASHNPSKYNGYKVYGADGCQITSAAAREIERRISGTDPFEDVKRMSFAEGEKWGLISWIGEETITAYIERVKEESMLKGEEGIDRNVAIVYTPLNGTGLKPVLRTLRESGFTNITVVDEQEKPDGNFPTCPYPNPEIREAMSLGITYATRCGADLLLATDPDCDRVGIAVRTNAGEYVLLSGNETGMLLLDFICKRRIQTGTMPERPICCKSVVTIDMAERIAADYGVEMVNVLTGFKYIGEQLGLLEQKGHEKDYIFGFEESYGYLSGGYVRDKDAVDASLLICEMFAYYRAQGLGLLDVLDGLYERYGYCLNTLHSYQFEGIEGAAAMERIMQDLHGIRPTGERAIGGLRIERIEDYRAGAVYEADGSERPMTGLPSSDVLKFRLENNSSLVVRPSGTEPKMKVYVSVSGKDRKEAEAGEAALAGDIERMIRKP